MTSRIKTHVFIRCYWCSGPAVRLGQKTSVVARPRRVSTEKPTHRAAHGGSRFPAEFRPRESSTGGTGHVGQNALHAPSHGPPHRLVGTHGRIGRIGNGTGAARWRAGECVCTRPQSTGHRLIEIVLFFVVLFCRPFFVVLFLFSSLFCFRPFFFRPCFNFSFVLVSTVFPPFFRPCFTFFFVKHLYRWVFLFHLCSSFTCFHRPTLLPHLETSKDL